MYAIIKKEEVTIRKEGIHLKSRAAVAFKAGDGGNEIQTRPFQLVIGRVWKGSAFGGVKGRTELPGMIEDFMNGKIDLNSFITHQLDFKDINEAFDLHIKGESIRTILTYGE